MPFNNNSSKTSYKQTCYDSYRIIDANLNRSKEGLRVCEDILRFHYNNKTLSKNFSNLRHTITGLIKKSKVDKKMLFKHRNSKDDIGQRFFLGPKRSTYKDIFFANSQRVKEGFRALEEFSKLFDTRLSKNIQKLRFEYYELEKKTVKKFPSLLDPR